MNLEEHIENLKAIASDMPSDKCADWIESLMAGINAMEELQSHREAWEKVRKGLRDKHSDPYSMHCAESYFIGVYDAMKIVDKYRPKEGENE